jgi:hypothetical protein
VSLGPVDATGPGSGLREGVQALPPSVAFLALPPGIEATREAGGEGGGGGAAAWQLLRQRSAFGDPVDRDDYTEDQRDAACALGLCAAFDQPGLPCSLLGRVWLSVTPPADPAAIGTYLGRCAELAARLRGGWLTLEVDETAAGAGLADGDGAFLGRVLGAVLPGAAPRLERLRVMLASRPPVFPPGFSRHLVAPAFPLLEKLELTAAAQMMTAQWRARTWPCCAAWWRLSSRRSPCWRAWTARSPTAA